MHARRHWIIRIGTDEIEVALQRIALERCRIGIPRAEVADGSRAHLLHLLGRNWRRRRIGRAFEELELGHDVGGLPRNFGALGRFVDAQANAVEHVLGRQAPFTNHFREGLSVGAVWAITIRRNGPGRGVERVQHAGLGIDQRKAPGKRLAGLHEWIGAASVQHHHAGLELECCQGTRVIGQTHCLERHIGCLGELGVNWDEIILALELHAVSGEIDEGDGVRTRALRLAKEIAHGLTQRLLIKISRSGDVETCRL